MIVPKEGTKITEEEIINLCKSRLVSYKKPKSVDIMDASAIPFEGGYKISKTKLRDKYREKYAKEKGKKIDRWGVV